MNPSGRKKLYYAAMAWCFFIFHAPQIWLAWFLLFPETGRGGLSEGLYNLIVFSGWALIHSLLPRNFIKTPLTRRFGEELYKLIFVSAAGISQCLLLYLWRPLNGLIWETDGLLYLLLTAGFVASMLMVLYSSIRLDYFEVLGIRGLLRRRRHEAPPARGLVVKGPYAHCRHPAYLGSILLFWIGPVMTAAKLQFALLGTIYIVLGTLLEERNTREELGPAYETYRRHVPMLIPRLRPWKP